MPFTLPPNSYISIFDFRLQFDLTDGTIKIDLSPTYGPSPYGATDVSVKITRPDMVVADLGAVFVPDATTTPPTAGTFNILYSWSLPKVQSVYMWGIYSVTCTLNLLGTLYPLTKKFNLCAPNSKDPYSSDLQGSILLSVDCQLGTMTARNFCGYAYRQTAPVSEEYNITRYYPPEAELLPQKNISVMPHVVDAYMGLNKEKGVNKSTYDFGDNIFAIIRIVAEAEKDIRCGLDMEGIYCGMKNLLAAMRKCNASQSDYNCAFGEINALIWTATAGLSENKDVDEEIARLEKLLGTECRCKACAGEKIGPGCVPACPQVSNIQAIVDPSTPANLKLIISWNGDSVPPGSKLQIMYRPFCDPGSTGAYTQLSPDVAITGGNQTISIPITDASTYQVLLTTIMPDGSYCDPVVITAPGTCPQVVQINQPPPVQNQFRVDWGWDPNAFTLAKAQGFSYQRNQLIQRGSPITVDFSAAPDLISYLVMRYSKSESQKLTWVAAALNHGQIPDQIFDWGQDGTYWYVWTRVKPALHLANNKQVTFT